MIAVRGHISRIALTAAVLGAVFAPPSVSAQSQLDSTDATDFLGSWTIAFETSQGPTTMTLNIEDRDGKVAARVSIPQVGEGIDITNISRSGPSLVMRYSLDFEGTPISASMTLRPEGERYMAALDFADGQFTLDANATRND